MNSKTITLNLPWPPSQNAIWRKNKTAVYRNPKYVRWIEQASWLVKLGKHQQIKGEFSATIVLIPPDKRPIDIDNRVKVLLDLAERMQLIENDNLCRLLVVVYGEGDIGAKLTLASMDSVSRETFLPSLAVAKTL